MPTARNSIPACLLSRRAVARISGPDRAAFLQGLISNDIGLCKPEMPLYAALLTPQGKFLHEFFIYDDGDCYRLDAEAERLEDLLQRLSTYKLRAKVTLEKDADWAVWAFPSGGAGLPDPRLPTLGSRGLFMKNSAPDTIDLIDEAAYDRHRLSLGVADGSRDMEIGKTALLDASFDLLNGVSWTKGCYIGQELTARMHHRALVKKRMLPVHIIGEAPPPDTPVLFGGTDIGSMRSTAGDIGLALLNLEQAQIAIREKAALDCGAARLTPVFPDWLKPAI